MIELGYQIVDGSVQWIDDFVVCQNSKEAETYIDRSEYERISTAIAEGVK